MFDDYDAGRIAIELAVVAVFVVLLFLVLIRPQLQRMREQRQVLSAIAVGDAVITAGGIVGKVVETGNERLQLEIAEGVNVAVSSKHIDGVAGH